MTPRSDRQPRRRMDPDSRRAAILGTARQAFGRAPYDEVSLAQVAAAAGASEALVHKYFEGKAGLYAEVTAAAIDDLAAAQLRADEELTPTASARDRVRISLLVYLDHIADAPTGWAGGMLFSSGDPAAAQAVRRRARGQYLDRLRQLLPASREVRHDYAMAGYFGFLDAACLTWVERGCPEAERWSLVDAALGGLEGALGDWRG